MILLFSVFIFSSASSQLTSPRLINRGFIPNFGAYSNKNGDLQISATAQGYGLANNGSVKNNLGHAFNTLFDFSKSMPKFDNSHRFNTKLLGELQSMCSKKEFYTTQNPQHRKASMKIMETLMEAGSDQEFIYLAASLRDMPQINPNAWLRGVAQASIFRNNNQEHSSFSLPPLVEIMPTMLINKRAIQGIEEQKLYPQEHRVCVSVDGSVGVDNGVENLLWYWREDVMVNSHHWTWHLSYPFQTSMPRRDRRGELFTFMHHNLVARYNAERLSNGLSTVPPLNIARGTPLQPFNPHLTDATSGNDYTPRIGYVAVSDTLSTALPNAPFFISTENRTLELNRILESIAHKTLLTAHHGPISLDNTEGIDLIGDIVEASVYSLNREYYGYNGIHNAGHALISLAVDPFQELNLPPGPMGDPGTALRDPIFYPYHQFLDNVFDGHKRTLSSGPYKRYEGEWPLVWDGVELLDVRVQVPQSSFPPNYLQTFWNEKKFDLSRGLDFNRTFVQGPVLACVKHLDHIDFQYEFIVASHHVHPVLATFRIFMAPRFNEKGRRYLLEEQRRRFFILDMFRAKVRPGMNKIVRHSANSALTIDFPQSYNELENDPFLQTTDCGCGWPHHLLIPKGSEKGMPFDIFVMATDAELDQVTKLEGNKGSCNTAPIFCGILGQLYPDARPMGYPFDRILLGPKTLGEWTKFVPNMASTKVVIKHVNG